MNTINTDELISFLLKTQQSKNMSIENLTNIFFQHLNLNNRAGTISAYKSTLKPVFKFFKSNQIIYINQITTDIINKYIQLRFNKVKNITINKEISNLKTMINFAISNEYLDKLPFKFKKLKETKPEIESIKKDDIIKILNYFKTTLKDKKYILAFMLMLTTGIRTTELLNIKNKNIDLKNKIIKLDFTKNGKERNIYIVDEIIELVSSISSKDEYLFTDNSHIKMTANNLRLFFKKIKRELDIDVLSPHKLRHFYATAIYTNSLDIYLTCNLLGHSDIKMTQIYLDINNQNNQAKNQIYNPIRMLDPLTH